MKKISIKAYSKWTTVSISRDVDIYMNQIDNVAQSIITDSKLYMRENDDKRYSYRINKRFTRSQVHELNKQLYQLAGLEFGNDMGQPFKKPVIVPSKIITGFTGCLITGKNLKFTNAPVINRQRAIIRDPWD